LKNTKRKTSHDIKVNSTIKTANMNWIVNKNGGAGIQKHCQ